MTAANTTPKPTPQTRANRLRGLELAVQMNSQREFQYTAETVLEIADQFADYLHLGPTKRKQTP